MSRVGVMHVTGGLMLGGLERVVVTIVNSLPAEVYDVHLCTTRFEGPMAEQVEARIPRLRLTRRLPFEPQAMRALKAYIREKDIRLLHAHGYALFMTAATVALMRNPPKLLWHDHTGSFEVKKPSAILHWPATRPVDGIISVTEALAQWARQTLRFPADRVWYLRNFVSEPPLVERCPDLPGSPGQRLVCVANLRPDKAQHKLVAAMKEVVRAVPGAHLLLVGNENDPAYAAHIRQEIARLGQESHVTILGARTDVPAILQACDVGVLGSDSEGLPMALIEYGMIRLPVAATSVGACADVLDEGQAGLVVPPGDPRRMAEALIELLTNHERRESLAQRLAIRVRELFGPEAGARRIRDVYDVLLGEPSRSR
jgi:glycosyltransferase involved in cell wall biosynthesis